MKKWIRKYGGLFFLTIIMPLAIAITSTLTYLAYEFSIGIDDEYALAWCLYITFATSVLLFLVFAFLWIYGWCCISVADRKLKKIHEETYRHARLFILDKAYEELEDPNKPYKSKKKYMVDYTFNGQKGSQRISFMDYQELKNGNTIPITINWELYKGILDLNSTQK